MFILDLGTRNNVSQHNIITGFVYSLSGEADQYLEETKMKKKKGKGRKC